jgi:anti-sigma factor ChrR (cupin superfamily)
VIAARHKHPGVEIVHVLEASLATEREVIFRRQVPR